MSTATSNNSQIDRFIARWAASGASERANCQPFLSELCELFGHHLHDEEILERLVALNAERAEEERQGHIRWLRPEFQVPAAATTKRRDAASTDKRPWPSTLPAQAQAVREALTTLNKPATPEEVAKAFQRANKARVAEISKPRPPWANAARQAMGGIRRSTGFQPGMPSAINPERQPTTRNPIPHGLEARATFAGCAAGGACRRARCG